MSEPNKPGGPDEPGSGPYRGPRAHDPEPTATPPEHDPAYVTRTKFLSAIAIAGGGVFTAAILVPVIGFAVAPTLEKEDYRWVDIGPLSDFPDNETSSIAVLGPASESDRRVFLRRKDDSLIAIWNRCAHLGCPVSYSRGGDNYSCPCHGGAYDSLGIVTAGPPPRPLDRFDVKLVDADSGQDIELAGAPDTARVLVGKPYSIDDEQRPYRLHGPGEPVTGVLSNLYPF